MYTYFIIPARNGPPDLPNFVFRMTPELSVLRQCFPPDVTLFGVSSDVLSKFRGFCVIHEIAEFVHDLLDSPGHCARAAREEITAVKAAPLSQESQTEYFRMRRQFFRDLIAYAEGSAAYSLQDIDEFCGSLAVFEAPPLDG